MIEKTINNNNSNSSMDEISRPDDDLSEYLEYISRTTPTTMPEWMN